VKNRSGRYLRYLIHVCLLLMRVAFCGILSAFRVSVYGYVCGNCPKFTKFMHVHGISQQTLWNFGFVKDFNKSEHIELWSTDGGRKGAM
jgi:hypothetical protein